MTLTRKLFTYALIFISLGFTVLMASAFIDSGPVFKTAEHSETTNASEQDARELRYENVSFSTVETTVTQPDWQNTRGIPVLCYHQVLPDNEYNRKPNPYALPLTRFKEQMQYLSQNNYVTITAEELTAYVQGQKSFSSGTKPVLITFDDGLKDYPRYAEPVMKQYGYKAVLFIYPTYAIAGKPRGMTFEQMKQARLRGNAIESHTYWHPLLNKMNSTEQRVQFKKSKQMLDKRTGADVRFLAYPFGIYTDESADVLKEAGYRAAFTIFPGNNLPGTDVYQLNRYMVVNTDSLKNFTYKLNIRSIPVKQLSPAPGSYIEKQTRVSAKLPPGLQKESISIIGDSGNFSYDTTTGDLVFQVKRPKNQSRILKIRYSVTEKYEYSFMYHRGIRPGA